MFPVFVVVCVVAAFGCRILASLVLEWSSRLPNWQCGKCGNGVWEVWEVWCAGMKCGKCGQCGKCGSVGMGIACGNGVWE